MRNSIELISMDEIAESAQSPVSAVIRTLVGLAGDTEGTKAMDCSFGGSAEEILVDAEVDGSRYLLVRLPKSQRSRVQLSPREHEIVRMVAKGHPNKVIADVLNISCWTVCTHLRRIFAKLGVCSRAAMVAQLLEMGIVTPEHRSPSNLR